MAAGTIFPMLVIASEGWFWTVERSNCTNFASRELVNLLRSSMNEAWPPFMMSG